MNLNKPIRITAVGKFLPKKIISSDLEKKFNIPIGWSDKNSGVKQRHGQIMKLLVLWEQKQHSHFR